MCKIFELCSPCFESVTVEILGSKVTLIHGASGSGKSALLIGALCREALRELSAVINARDIRRLRISDRRIPDYDFEAERSQALRVPLILSEYVTLPRISVAEILNVPDDLLMTVLRHGIRNCAVCNAGMARVLPSDVARRVAEAKLPGRLLLGLNVPAVAAARILPEFLRLGFNRIATSEALYRLSEGAGAELRQRLTSESSMLLVVDSLSPESVEYRRVEESLQRSLSLRAHFADYGVPADALAAVQPVELLSKEESVWKLRAAAKPEFCAGAYFCASCGAVDDSLLSENPAVVAAEAYCGCSGREKARCSKCKGTGFSSAVLRTYLSGKTVPQLLAMPISSLCEVISPYDGGVPNVLRNVERCRLGHIALADSAEILSTSERWKLRLIELMSAELSDMLFAFDGPSHVLDRDNLMLLNGCAADLADRGNSVAIADSSMQFEAAERLIELKTERKDGRLQSAVVYQGQAAGHELNPEENRAARIEYKAGAAFSVSFSHPRTRGKARELTFHRECINAVIGNNGSGKTYLLRNILAQAPSAKNNAVSYRFKGRVFIDCRSSLEDFRQKTPLLFVSLAGVLPLLADIFAALPAARRLGLSPQSFLLDKNSARCEHCSGAGVVEEDSGPLLQNFERCEVCLGQFYKRELLEVRYGEHSLPALFGLTPRALTKLFSHQPRLVRMLQMLVESGLGDYQLSRPVRLLPYGARQTLSIVPVLSAQRVKDRLFLLDEPFTGRRSNEVDGLMALLEIKAREGATIVYSVSDHSFRGHSKYFAAL